MSMFGPLSRLRASRQQDVSGMDPYGSGQPMAPAPMDWAEYLRRTAGVRREQANPVQQAYDAKLAEYAPQQAKNVNVPMGSDIYRRREELNKQLFRLLSMGRANNHNFDLQNEMLRGERSMLNDLTAGEHAQAKIDEANALYKRSDDESKRVFAEAKAHLGLDTNASMPDGAIEQMIHRGDFKAADDASRRATELLYQWRPEGITGKQIYDRDIANASNVRERLQKYMQQRADDELMTRNRQKADMRLADEGKALEAASNTAKLQMLVNAARKGASDADLAEIMASPDVLGRRLNREDKAAAQQSELADLQIQSARNKVNQERDAYDPQLAADEKTLRRLDVQSKLMQARAGNDIEGKSINFEKALADPQFKDLAETTSVLAAQLIADGNNEVGGDTLLSSVEQLNKYLASMPAADAKRMAGYIRTQLAKAGVKRLDTDFFTKGSAYFNPLRFTQYDTQRKSQQAVKALEYVLSKAGEPAE